MKPNSIRRSSRRCGRSFHAALAGVLSAWLGACAAPDRSEPEEAQPPMSAVGRPKTPYEERVFAYGPSIEPHSGLVAWLASSRELDAPALLRLPVRLRLDGNRLRLDDAAIASASTDVLPHVALDDSAMGLSLRDRVRPLLQDSRSCLAWLEGRWTEVDGRKGLRVFRCVGAVSAEEQAAPLFARCAYPREAAPELVEAIELLGAEVPSERKSVAKEQLRTAGIAAIPVLIAALGDDRRYAKRDAVNRQNAPPHTNPEPPLIVETPVSWVVRDLLYEIIEPAAGDAVDFRGKVFSEQVLAVADWHAFWSKRHAMSLAEIHAELRPLVDAYWRQHGTTQRVD